MAKRVVSKRESGGGNYFSTPKTLNFIPSGCKVLDLVLGGGGWAGGRMVNVVGDKATGKTLLAIEACANFAATYKTGKIYYREGESAFDEDYAKAIGFPTGRVDFAKPRTVEDVFEELDKLLKLNERCLYIIDSLDSLSDRAELARKIDKGSYGTAKASILSEMFRRLIDRIEASNMTLFIVSQVRDNIGVMMGAKQKRSGGKSMDFYASQVVWLHHMGRIKKTINNTERVIGVRVKAKVEKNKVGLPFRQCEFEIMFGYGIDDAGASLDYLEDAKALARVGLTGFVKGKDGKPTKTTKINKYRQELEDFTREEYNAELVDLHKAVEDHWWETEKSFLPTRKKYADA
jgi:recombination protein RecA